MPSDALFGPSLSSEAVRRAVSDAAWLQAMLDVEAALARVEARLGVIPEATAGEIERHCQADGFDIEAIGRSAVASANPVVPLVRALRAAVSKEAAPFVHLGATSQDVLDSAMMLVSRQAIDALLDDLHAAASCAAKLAERHRSTAMAARTLLQQASVTSFGLKSAGWLITMVEAIEALQAVRRGLAVQLGGAVGTLAALGDHGLEVLQDLAARLELEAPPIPWHTDRSRIVKIASAVAMAAGSAGKVALDVVLLAQTEVGEVREASQPDRGGSSALPQKQNPVGAIEILAAVRGVNAQVGTLVGSMPQEHERAAGAWQAEWLALSELFLFAGGATSRLAGMLSTLEIDSDRMRRNLELTGGLVMAEAVTTRLAQRTDPSRARALVDAAISRARQDGRSFTQVLSDDEEIRRHVSPDELRAAMDPANYLGESSTLIDRALVRHRSERGHQ